MNRRRSVETSGQPVKTNCFYDGWDKYSGDLFTGCAAPLPVSKTMVWEAYKKVKANKGSAGIDGISLEEFEQKLENDLYKIWNRMSSGSYFPPAVKEVEIPKKDGKVRKLCITTISDGIAQMVIKDLVEGRFEGIFLPQSYGYRSLKSAYQALEAVRQNVRKYNWVKGHISPIYY